MAQMFLLPSIPRGVILREAGPAQLWTNVSALVAMRVVLVAVSVRSFKDRARGKGADASPARACTADKRACGADKYAPSGSKYALLSAPQARLSVPLARASDASASFGSASALLALARPPLDTGPARL